MQNITAETRTDIATFAAEIVGQMSQDDINDFVADAWFEGIDRMADEAGVNEGELLAAVTSLVVERRDMEAIVQAAPNLDELARLLNEVATAEEHERLDTTSLPTFGGTDIVSSEGFYSWDETRFLVPSDGRNRWEIVPRADYPNAR